HGHQWVSHVDGSVDRGRVVLGIAQDHVLHAAGTVRNLHPVVNPVAGAEVVDYKLGVMQLAGAGELEVAERARNASLGRYRTTDVRHRALEDGLQPGEFAFVQRELDAEL